MVYRCVAPESAEESYPSIPTLEREVTVLMNQTASALSGTRARWFRRSVAVMACLALGLFAVVLGGCGDDDGGDVNYPNPEPEIQRNWVFDVHGNAADDVYAVGNKGTIFHYDGSTWTASDMGVNSAITSIYGSGGGTLYAAGHDGHFWRNTGGTWSSLDSGTDMDFYDVGMYRDEIYAVGEKGLVRRLNGNALVGVDDVIVIRNVQTGAPEDTLSLNEDIFSLVTINHSFIGGAYILPDEDVFGITGTDGMVLAADSQPDLYDWILRPLGSDQFAISEWILCTTNDPVTVGNNYLGTSEGWIYRLSDSGGGRLDWVLMIPDTTFDRGNGIRDMWVDGDNNLYAVTDDGNLVFQTGDFDFNSDTGVRNIYEISHGSLTGIWGSDAQNLFMTGFNENVIIQASLNLADYTITFEEVPVVFPAKSGGDLETGKDHQGLPRF